jgi:hypothetical protein
MVQAQTATNGPVASPPAGAAPAAPSPPIFPMLIGVSGKRTLETTSAAADEQREESVRRRLAEVFEALERKFPRTPKIVITGAALGTDLIAAEAALDMGGHWAVAAILPFERSLFEEDFALPPKWAGDAGWRARYDHHGETFRRVMGDPGKPNPRVLVRELPKLIDQNFEAVRWEALTHTNPNRDKIVRRNHYEQVGQFIAEISTIMIAVMAGGEEPEVNEADGGTARVVAYRRAGRPDALGTDVARRSAILRNEWSDLVRPPAASVWLIDPAREDRTGRYPVTVLPPLTDRGPEEVYRGHPGLDLAGEPHVYVGPIRWVANGCRTLAASVGLADPKRPVARRRLRASLVLARGLERFHAAPSDRARAPQSAAALDLRAPESASAGLETARGIISGRQRVAKSTSTSAFRLLAWSFLGAVLAFEIFAKFFHDSWYWLGAYLFLLAFIAGIAIGARWKLWQAVAEDYRAVAEMLRVQRAWWAAGLSLRVDREHLEGAADDLAPIRDAAKTVVAWILLLCGWQDPARRVDWAYVRGKQARARDLRDEPTPRDWIGGQLGYFTKNVEERENQVQRIDAASWSLFVASGVLGLVLWSWLRFPFIRTCFEALVHAISGAIEPALPYNVQPFGWVVIAAWAIDFRICNRDIRKGWPAAALTATLGAVAALAIVFTLLSACDWISELTWLEGDEKIQAVPRAIMVCLVVLTAWAGALRYLVERLNIEAEALDYRAARERFERAERELAAGADPQTGTPADQAKACALVRELGFLALEENEAWLKSRRERPLTPVVG